MAVWPPEPPASNAKHSGALYRGFERALAPRLARDFGPQQGASWQIIYNLRMYPSTVQSNDLFHRPIHRPSRQLANRAGTPRAATNWRARRSYRHPGELPGMSRPPTGESIPAEHNGLAPAGSPLPSKRPALPGPLMGRYKTNKSSQGRADAQRLVATRLLDRLHDPLGHFSRLQRIYPRAR